MDEDSKARMAFRKFPLDSFTMAPIWSSEHLNPSAWPIWYKMEEI